MKIWITMAFISAVYVAPKIRNTINKIVVGDDDPIIDAILLMGVISGTVIVCHAIDDIHEIRIGLEELNRKVGSNVL